MKKIIIVIQMVLISFLFTNLIYAQSELDSGIVGLKDKNTSIRRNAAKALGRLNDKRAVTSLVAALKDEDKWVRSLAVMALGELEDKRAVVPIIAVLMAKDEYGFVRENATEALKKLKDKRTFLLLIEELKDENGTRAPAAYALGKLKDKRAVVPLIAALMDEDNGVRALAAKALGELEDKRGIVPLTAALKDNDSNVSKVASNALDKLKNKRDVVQLSSALKTSKETLLKAYSLTNDYAKKLKGLEYYFVEITKNKPKVTFEKIRLLMIHNKVSLPSEVEKHYSELENPNYPYKINLLDKRSGYLKLNCIGCENTMFMTYWNVTDGSKLIGLVNRGCGPACSDQVYFYKYKNNQLASIPGIEVIPSIKKSDFRNNVKLTVPSVFEGMTPEEFENMEPWEVTYNLPRSGKDILVSFDIEAKTYFNGNCMKLLWQDGKFSRTPISYCKHKP